MPIAAQYERNLTWAAIVACLLAAAGPRMPAIAAEVSFAEDGTAIRIRIDQHEVARYIYQDPELPRPYFAHVATRSGQPVTRAHPPVPGIDREDHATMHPGIWLAFGDLSGEDFWRNRGQVVHSGFLEPPRGGPERGAFVQEKEYLAADGRRICIEQFRCEVRVGRGGYFLLWDSQFHNQQSFVFGDQEEMGLGVRVATPLSELEGGTLVDALGRRGAARIWSHSADWCDAHLATAAGLRGVTLLTHPDNHRPSWFHVRDYGLLVANPFGRQAMQKGAASRITVQPHVRFRLRFGIWIYESTQQATALTPSQAYAAYLAAASEGDLSPGESPDELK